MRRRAFLKTIGGIAAGLAASVMAPSPTAAAPLFVPSERLAYGSPRRALYVPEPAKLVIPTSERFVGSGIYRTFRENLLAGDGLDWNADTIRVSLHDDDFSEISAPGYGAKTVPAALRIDQEHDAVVLDIDDVRWSNVSMNPRYAVIHAGRQGFIAQVDLGSPVVAAGDLDIVWPPAGAIKFL